MVSNLDHVAVKKLDKVCSANIKQVVASLIMLVYLHASSSE